MSASPPPGDIQLTHPEIDRLREVIETWSSKSRLEKREQKEKLVDEFLRGRSIEQTNGYAREFLRMKITHWFSNNAPTKDARLPRSLRTVWTAREVFYIREQESIAARQKELLDEGEKTHSIAALNTARAELWAALSPDEKDEFEQQADEWTADGPDRELRAMVAEKRLGDWVASFIALLWDQAGAVSEITFYYLDRLSKIKWGRYDISLHWHRNDPKVPRFIDLFTDWQSDYFDRYGRYARMTLLPTTADTENEKGLTRKRPEPDIDLQLYPDGTPILPPITEPRFKLQTAKEAAMRAFMTLHWSLASGVKDTRVAWTEVSANPNEYFRPGLFPPELRVVEPTRMTARPMRQWWMRIVELQDSGDEEQRFRFTHWWNGSERLEAQYNGTPVEKNPAKAVRQRRVRIATGPPKGAMEAWTGEQRGADEAPGALGTAGTSSSAGTDVEGTEVEGTEVEGTQTTGTSGKKKRKRGPKRARTEATAKTTTTSKGKAKAPAPKRQRTNATESSDSAESSLAGSDGARSPVLSSDGSPDETDVESSSEDHPVQVQTRRVLPTPVRKVGQVPDAQVVAVARTQPPNWVGRTATRVWPYLYALSDDIKYRDALACWTHLFGRLENLDKGGPGKWASWSSSTWGIPEDVHSSRKHIDKLFSWLAKHIPTPDASGRQVQQWFLTMGLTLRHAHTANSIDPDDEQLAIPNGGPEYLRSCLVTFADIASTLEPMCEQAKVAKPGQSGTSGTSGQPGRSGQSGQPGPTAASQDVPPSPPSATPVGSPTRTLSAMSALTSLPATTVATHLRRRKADLGESSGESSDEVEQQVKMHVDDEPSSISEARAAQHRTPGQRKKVTIAVQSGAIARRTRGQAKLPRGDIPPEPATEPLHPAPQAAVRRSSRRAQVKR